MSLHGMRCDCGVVRLGLNLTEMERSRFLAEHHDDGGPRHRVDIFEAVEGALAWRTARGPFQVCVPLDVWVARFTSVTPCVCRGNPFVKCECPCGRCRGRSMCIDIYGPG